MRRRDTINENEFGVLEFASMGPPHVCGGEVERRGEDSGGGLASMGPPHVCGGEPAFSRKLMNDSSASMGPPHVCGGEWSQTGSAPPPHCRGFNGAAARMRRRASRRG